MAGCEFFLLLLLPREPPQIQMLETTMLTWYRHRDRFMAASKVLGEESVREQAQPSGQR